MASSPGHKLGQIIGDVLEKTVAPLLGDFARRHNLFLDKKGRRAARPGLNVTWTDSNGNAHDLDFVLERNGTEVEQGTPVAFIETAWRRYTKHSRNKAQEIQGAILPLAETFKGVTPFMGAILAGVFTEGALLHLKSLGFSILHFPYETVLSAFESAGVNVGFDEATSDRDLALKVRAWRRSRKKGVVPEELLRANRAKVDEFIFALENSVTRRVTRVRILPLHGSALECMTVQEAIAFVTAYTEENISRPLTRYEIQILYNNGDKIEGQFGDRPGALRFLSGFLA